MAPKTPISLSFLFLILPIFFFIQALSAPNYNYNYQKAYNELSYDFYDKSCPRLPSIIRYRVWAAVQNDSRIAASLLRLQFHDCIVDGCEASVMLDDTKDMKGEKNAPGNVKSLRGFEVIDDIKMDVETYCPETVSCVDILGLAAREAVYLVGGPSWNLPLGRRDGLTASKKSVLEQLPSPKASLENNTAKFTSKGLDLKDLVVLSGAHTIGFARCVTFKVRLFNYKGSGQPDPDINAAMLSDLQSMCPNRNDGTNANLAPLDVVTVDRFDNEYYTNLISGVGLLESDHSLMADSYAAHMVRQYSYDTNLFYDDFAESMLRMSLVGVLSGRDGQIRKNCHVVNVDDGY
ncbi:peroxidase 10-like [Cucurbita moschata]|uniref:Peroxidase n=1 Tax=Cucurbita moschata TaxID=3662 RepID=A0A6J1G5V6_CUCMO|nr:peroxidase 10-like [Cucurbita moschata]